jgi:putative cardiolipin synthase
LRKLDICNRRVLFVFFPLLLTACASLDPRPELPEEFALAASSDTYLDKAVGNAERAHPGQSGFRLVDDGQEAFVLRWHSAGLAERSIDVQTYIWHADTTGLSLAARLLEAADRGVHVRLLLDDMDARAKNIGFASLQAHPNIEVRMFNPFASRKGIVSFLGEAVTSFKRINRRMHNKSWLADNRVALAGGRNLGDEYFDASEESNFEDLDFVMVGPVVQDISASFDRFWNATVTYPIELLDPDSVNTENLENLRRGLSAALEDAKGSRYAEGLRKSEPIRQLLQSELQLEWSSDYVFVSDDPLKATGTLGEDASNVGKTLSPVMRGATSELNIISPYFVPGEQGTAALVELAKSSVKVHVLTNSLAANDVAAVHGGYSSRRKALLEGGVKLAEIKPTGGTQAPSSLRGSSGAALHTKAMTIDAEHLFVGSYNIDPRSANLNSEQGVLVRNPVLTKQLIEIFTLQTSAERSWTVSQEDGKLRWTDGTENFDSDPKASMGKRFQAWFARTFGLESQL